VRSARYRRTFVLTNALDTDSVEASMKGGVLSIRIPKRAELKPRQIEIQTA
jgi:HSP20 family protein